MSNEPRRAPARAAAEQLTCSVVIATYNRLEALQRLLGDLGRQAIGGQAFDVVVVDDGSAIPVGPHLDKLELPYALRWIRQDNAGQAAARQCGVEAAAGEVIVIVDDDMQLPPTFLAAHLAAHRSGAEVVLGHIRSPDDEASTAPLFERFHLEQLRQFVEALSSGEVELCGAHLCTGNVSFRREHFLEVGGFDASLRRSEDRELGIRLEKRGLKLAFARDAVSVHHTDHDDSKVLDRAFQYGAFDARISKKHRDYPRADPWAFLFDVHPVSRPLLLSSALFPRAASRVSALAQRTAKALDAAGISRVAVKGATFVYGVEYFRGVREEAGSAGSAVSGFIEHLARRRAERDTPGGRALRGVLGDFDFERAAKKKYFDDDIPSWRLPVEVVQKIGLQMMTAVRVMGWLRDSPIPLGEKVASRLIRHLYAAEIHWDADIAPGVAIVHGNGLVISHAARVDAGCILFHNVTLGEGIDPETREVGGPHLERNVHVGPGATIVGPITVGEGTKIAAGATLMQSVPPFSLVAQAPTEIRQRDRAPKAKGRR